MALTSLFYDYWDAKWLVGGILALSTLFYVYALHCFNYWKKRNIPHIPGTFPFGSAGKLILQKQGLVEQFLELYRNIEGKYAGFYFLLQPQILIKDLDLIKDVLVKNFSDFADRGMYYNESVDPLSAHLFAIEGNHWKNMRSKLSPTFTSGKMKYMYPTIKECAIDLQKYGIRMIKKSQIIDFKDMTMRFGLDVISSTTLGLIGNNFVEENTEMKRVASMITSPNTLQMIRVTFAMMCKNVAKVLRLRFVEKEVSDYFLRIVTANTAYREKNDIKRNDFMQQLIDLKNNKVDVDYNDVSNGKGTNNVTMTIEEMAAQSFVFVAAGFETSSVTLSFCLYELALNQHIQEKLIAELDAAGDDLSYDVLNGLPYLEMVVNETLRKYPPVANLQREASKDYVLPGGQVVDKGTLFMISVIGLHMDPKLFPNPEVFDPERFSTENIGKILPYSYLPFGDGPRICIGKRFGKMQVKLALAAMLSRFKVDVCDKTPIPLKIEKKTFIYNVEGGVFLRATDRKPEADREY